MNALHAQFCDALDGLRTQCVQNSAKPVSKQQTIGTMPDSANTQQLAAQLLPRIQELIDSARGRAVAAVNAELTVLYWQIGKLLKEHLLEGERGQYGKQAIKQLAADLTVKYGKGWSHQQLRHCLRAVETFPDPNSEIVSMIYIDDDGVPELQLERKTLRRLLIELQDEGRVHAEGENRWARHFPGPADVGDAS